MVKELDIPLAYIPKEGWFNWFGGAARRYDPSRLNAQNHDTISFDQWLKLVERSPP